MTQTLFRGQSAVQEGAERISLGGRRSISPERMGRVAEALALFGAAASGDRRAVADLQEALSTSDFASLFGDGISRTLSQRYQAIAPVWQQWATRTTVRDFRPAKIVDLLGGNSRLSAVAEHAPYPRGSYSDAEIEILVAKYGRALAWSWEMTVNDDLGALQRAPGDLALSARRTEDYLVTSALTGASGPLSWVGTSNAVGAVPLTAANVEAGLQAITDAQDDAGNPIDIGTPVLMVPRALALTAKNIVSTTLVRTQNGTGSGSTLTDIAGNGLSATPRIVVNPWLSVVDTSNKSATTWYLLPEPNGPRPAVFAAFLRGHEDPDIRQRNDAGVRPGGGQVDPGEGDFEHDDIEYRVRHVAGAAQGYSDAVYASRGS